MIRPDLEKCFQKGSFSEYLNHADVVMNLLNQIAHGSRSDARTLVDHLGGDIQFAEELFDASRAVIKEPEGGWDARR